jgi:hypothetical protein
VWKCITHEDCEMKVKVVSTDDGYELFSSMDEHAEVRAALPGNFKGISAEFERAVKELVGRSYPPQPDIFRAHCAMRRRRAQEGAYSD